jgi:hypothetical protein
MVLHTTHHYELTADQEENVTAACHVKSRKSVSVHGMKDYEGVKIQLHSFLTEQEAAQKAQTVWK